MGMARAHRWPGDARCVVCVTCDFDGHGNEVGLGHDPVGIRSAGGYSARRGVRRMLDIFHRHGVPATFFVPGYDAEQHPDLVREIVAAGHEIAAHGYKHERTAPPPAEEEALLRHSHAVLADLAGRPPLGWRSPGGQKTSVTTRMHRELGYIYDSSDKDHDLPYPAMSEAPGQAPGGPGGADGPTADSPGMIELPNNTSSLDDFPLYVEGAATPAEVLQLWRDEFDTLYHDTGYYMLTFHPRAGFGSGTPARARVVDRLLGYIRGVPGVHFARLGDLARWTLDPANGFLAPPIPTGGRP